jgi:cysteine desulfurase/selenocysteine lyase
MSTDDRNRDVPGEPAGPWPDAAALTRLANELFTSWQGQATSSSPVPASAAPTAWLPTPGELEPPSVPSSQFYFLDERAHAVRPYLPDTAHAVRPYLPDTAHTVRPYSLDDSAHAARPYLPEETAQAARPYSAESGAVPASAHGAPFSLTPPTALPAFEFRPDLVPNLNLTPGLFDVASVRRDFPILNEVVHGRRLVWLDNAATTQKPQSVIDRIAHFYEHENSNVHRAAHALATRATDAYEASREKVRRFLNASSTDEIAFVRGATEGVNLVAQSWGRRHIGKDDEIVITWLEHHSNIVPWQLLAAEKGARLRVAPIDDDGQVILDEYERLLGPRTRLVSFAHVSNALGTVTPVREMVQMAHRHGARVLVDGAQAISHMPVDVQALDCDFYVFSGHKVFGPTGIGVVRGKPEAFEESPPWQGGGNMIKDVTFEKTVYQNPPLRFEAGTGNIADAVGLGAALDYLDELGMANVWQHEHELLAYGTEALRTIPGLRLIGTAPEKAGVMSFVLEGFRSEDVGKALDREGIAVRAGHHCAQPALRRFGVETSVRPSLAVYNTHEDIDALIAALRKLRPF